MTIKKILVTILMVIIATSVYAQSPGDVLYNQGLEAQKVQSTASQKKAIDLFTKAKVAYDSPDNKAKCDQQISVCNKNIERYAQIAKEKKAKDNGDIEFRMGEQKFSEKNFTDAMECFQRAKETYMSKEDKDQCQEKIDLCKEELDKLVAAAKVEEPVVKEPEDSIGVYDAENNRLTDYPMLEFKPGNKNTSQTKILIIKASREDWTYSNNSPTWLSVSQDKNSSIPTITLTIVGKNNTGSVRTAIVTLISGNKELQLIVNQQTDALNKLFKGNKKK